MKELPIISTCLKIQAKLTIPSLRKLKQGNRKENGEKEKSLKAKRKRFRIIFDNGILKTIKMPLAMPIRHFSFRELIFKLQKRNSKENLSSMVQSKRSG